MIEHTTTKKQGTGVFFILLGQDGVGKAYAIDAILTTLTSEHNFNADNYKMYATTGKTAILIGRSTLHSYKE
eukprot:12077843-Ditylum_brightwellii.AAC.1